MGCLVPRTNLTPNQLRAVELSPEEHRVFAGPPGCGKTLVLMHRAAFLRDRYGVPPDRFRIFVYTNALKRYIQGELPLLNLSVDSVSTFDSWCVQFHRQRISRNLPQAESQDIPDFSKVREAVAAKLRASPPKEKLYHFAMVDEGQDLDAASFDILKTIAAHVTVCTDVKQQIFDRGSTEREIVARLGVRRRNVSFLEAFRCCPHVARLAAPFIADPDERAVFLSQVRTGLGEREVPLLFVARSAREESARLTEILRLRLARSERVAIILPRTRMVFGLANRLQAEGIEVETYRHMRFDNDRPKVTSFHSAKGLTVDTVLMPRLNAAGFAKFGAEVTERLLFVGITRALRWVYLSTVSNDSTVFRPLQRLVEAADGPPLSVQYGHDGGVQMGLFDPEQGRTSAQGGTHGAAPEPVQVDTSEDDEFSLV